VIADEVVVEAWPPPPAQAVYPNRHLVIDEHKYWAMGPRGDLDPPEEMTVIDRAVHPSPDSPSAVIGVPAPSRNQRSRPGRGHDAPT
jgi:hypothetical protein